MTRAKNSWGTFFNDLVYMITQGWPDLFMTAIGSWTSRACSRFFHAFSVFIRTPASERLLVKPKPPAIAESLLGRLAPSEWKEALLGDFLERYERKFPKTVNVRIIFLARVDYWWQVVRSVPGFIRIRAARRLLKCWVFFSFL